MKSVVIASGKGGTGKTTLTALFVHLASREMRVAVADADVEASNLPLALRVLDAACDEFVGGQKASIDEAACSGCGLCAEACRFDAVVENHGGGGSAPAYSIDSWLCEGCAACAYVCPAGAVRLESGRAGTACTGTSVVGPIAFGQLGPGEDLSGRLVTEVRQRARRAAEASGAQLLLLDGPPGVGCPVIAALASTDLLVAVTEPTRSGGHDLVRLAALAARFDLPVRVILNKADLSADGAAELAKECRTRGLPLCAEIPFDPVLASALVHLGEGGSMEEALEGTVAREPLEQAWRAVKSAVWLDSA